MNHPRIAYITNRLPWPLDDGWKVRAFHIARAISRVASLHTFSLRPDPTSADDVGAYEAALSASAASSMRTTLVPHDASLTLRHLINGIVGSTPLPVCRLQSSRMEAVLREQHTTERFDLCVVALSYMFPAARALGVPVVIDTHNIDSVVMERYSTRLPALKRWYAALTARKLTRFEQRVFQEARETWVCSTDEQTQLTARGSQSVVLPNGVDCAQYGASSPEASTRKGALFFGRLDYFPNLDALRFIREELEGVMSASSVDIPLTIVGAGADSEAVQTAVRGSQFMSLTGKVPDIRVCLESSRMLIVPLRMGGGTRLKILEAMGAGLPVVTTRIGVEGIPVVDGEHVIIAETPLDFCMAMKRLQHDNTLWAVLSENARRLARRYDWQGVETSVGHRLESILNSPRVA